MKKFLQILVFVVVFTVKAVKLITWDVLAKLFVESWAIASKF